MEHWRMRHWLPFSLFPSPCLFRALYPCLPLIFLPHASKGPNHSGTQRNSSSSQFEVLNKPRGAQDLLLTSTNTKPAQMTPCTHQTSTTKFSVVSFATGEVLEVGTSELGDIE